VPYVLILFYAIYSAITGIRYNFLFSSETLYGFKGLLYGLATGLLWFFYIPIIPICLTYQIAYLTLRKSEKKKFIWISTLSVTIILCLIVVGLNIAKSNRAVENSRIEAEIKFNVNEISKIADKVITYGNSIDAGGIAGTKYTQDTMFIDYESKKIAFFYNDYGIKYKEFTLTEGKTSHVNNVQYKAELVYPAKTLTIFYLNDSEKHRTIAIELLMCDGSVYSIDGMTDDYGRFGFFPGSSLLFIQE
jgi:hypothetical protein